MSRVGGRGFVCESVVGESGRGLVCESVVGELSRGGGVCQLWWVSGPLSPEPQPL